LREKKSFHNDLLESLARKQRLPRHPFAPFLIRQTVYNAAFSWRDGVPRFCLLWGDTRDFKHDRKEIAP